jgi:membrane-associated phospholipid phosphatase
MWFADTGLGLGWGLLALWLVAVVLTASMPTLRTRLPGRSILPVVIGSGGVTALVLAQAAVVDGVADSAGPGALDRSVLGWFLAARSPAVTLLMRAVSTAGGTAGMAVLALTGAGLLWRARRRAAAAVVIVAAAGAGILVEGFKHLYGRSRPPVEDRLTTEGTFSLPSGHALGSMVVLGVLAAVVVLVGRRAAKVGAVTLAAAGIAVIGVSRLYLGVHWVTDVLTGWLLGGAWLTACVTALTLLETPSPSPHTPASNESAASRSSDAW